MADEALASSVATLSAVFIFGGDIMRAEDREHLGGLGWRSLRGLERDKTGPMRRDSQRKSSVSWMLCAEVWTQSALAVGAGKASGVQQRIGRRRNPYLRRLLINGASANLLRSKATNADPWVIGLRQRRPSLVVAVALANKTARIAWAVMHRHENYQRVAAAA